MRSVVKGIAWRALATLATIGLVYGFTRKPVLALEVGGLEVVVKLLLYYGHERAWNAIDWGRQVAPTGLNEQPRAACTAHCEPDSEEIEETTGVSG